MTRNMAAASAILITLVSAEAFAQGGPQRVTICHVPPGNPANGRTLTLPEPAIQAHLGHGDVMGPCAAGANRSGIESGNRNNQSRNDVRRTPQGGAREDAEAEGVEEEEAEEEEEETATTPPGASGKQPSGADRGGRGGKPQPGNTSATRPEAASTKKPPAPPRKQP